MFLVGLTGGIATGKSTVSSIFNQQGIPVIDADEIARKSLAEPGTDVWNEIKREFGSEFFDKSGHLKREELGRKVFSDANKRKLLNEITHSKIRNEIWMQIFRYTIRGHRYVLLDIPLLFESEMNKFMQKTIVVFCPKNMQLQRLMARNGMNHIDAENRITSQMSLNEKCQRSSYVIDSID